MRILVLVVLFALGIGGTAFAASPDNSYLADLNADRKIDLCDFARFANNWLKEGPYLKGNFDGSGSVDINDLAFFVSCWLYTLADSDGDGMPDGWETANNLNPLVNDANGDPDGDGVTNLQEYQQGSDPHRAGAPSITQYGITWTFDTYYPVGQFVNGDWWVVGPVNIIDISPAASVYTYVGPCSDTYRAIGTHQRAINGSMLNPPMMAIGASQGYDGAIGGYAGPSSDTTVSFAYNAALNVAAGVSVYNPLTISGGNSLISTISLSDIFPQTCNCDPIQYQKYVLKTAAVLTVLTAVPAADSFRPSYYYKGSPKTVDYRWSTVTGNLSLLPNKNVNVSFLRTADGSWTGELASFLPCIQRIWLDHSSSWANEYFAPQDNMDDYGTLLAHKLGWASLLCLTQLPSDWTSGSPSLRDQLLIHLIQKGIDWAGAVQNQGNGLNGWWPDGGHSLGRKWPVMFAALMLGDGVLLNNIKNKSGDNVTPLYGLEFGQDYATWGDKILFAEDGQTFFVQQADIYDHNTTMNYVSGDIGLPEYGMYHAQIPHADNKYLISDHRQINTGSVYGAFALAALIMNQKTNWNHNAFFYYTDRWIEICSYSAPYNSGNWKFQETSIALAMWNTYRGDYAPIWTRIYNTSPDFSDLLNPNNSAYSNGSAR